jgi:precorrin-3B synthase
VTDVTDRSPVQKQVQSSKIARKLTDPADRRSACPGLFRLAPALDGGICRVKLAAGRLSADQAEAVAHAAGRFSTAPIELTNRANFQIRAVQPENELALVEALVEAGLGPQPAQGETASCAVDDPVLLGSDDVRNVMVSPLAGRDPQQIIDILPLAERLLATLQGERRYHALSPKFAIQLDAGEAVAMLSHPHDIWLAVISPDQVALGLASCMPVAGDSTAPRSDRALAAAPLARAHDLVCAALDLFLEISAAHAGVNRMKQVPAELAGTCFIDRLQARLPFALRRDATLADWRRAPTTRGSHLGVIAECSSQAKLSAHTDPAAHRDSSAETPHPNPPPNRGREGRGPGGTAATAAVSDSSVLVDTVSAATVSIGAMPSLGRLLPTQLSAVAGLARRYGDGTLRFTPWQGLILPRVAAAEAANLLRELSALGLTTEAVAPFAQMIACTGSAGCGSALAATQSDGAALADLLAARNMAFPVHLSGCGKSCAALRAEPATLVGVSPGHYDLYRRQVGASSRFGVLQAANITLPEAADLLARFADKKRADEKAGNA